MKKAYAEMRRDGSDVCGGQPGVRHLPNAGRQGIREAKLVPPGESEIRENKLAPPGGREIRENKLASSGGSEIRENKRASSPRKRGSILTFKNQWIPAFAGMTTS